MSRTPFNYAFIGMAKGILQDEGLDLNMLPNSILDGINENHVAVNINVVSKADLDNRNLGNFFGTNPGKEPVHILCVPALILSRAKSAVHAIELMNNINIFGNLVELEYLHFMISDEDDTFIVEIIDDKLNVIGFLSNKHHINDEIIREFPIMTNWYIANEQFDKSSLIRGKYTENGCGIERYEHLEKIYPSIENSMAGVFNAMKSVRFTNEILLDPAVDSHFPFSDFGFGAKYTKVDYLNDADFK